MTPITAPGVYDLSRRDYHLDPCPLPSLSASIAKLLVERSPAHAWQAHPRLTPNWQPSHSTKFDDGNVMHDLLLGSDQGLVVVDAENYRTKAAQSARDMAYERWQTPVLRGRYDELVIETRRIARAIERRWPELHKALADGKAEQALIWQEGPIWCRLRLDNLPPAGWTVFTDLKTTTNARPDEFAKRVWDTGHAVQWAFYRRGIKAVLGIEEPVFQFLVLENQPPYAMSLVDLEPGAAHIADEMVERAIGMWTYCQAENWWPDYPARKAYVEAPPWVKYRWEEQRANREIRRELDETEKRLAMEAQAPLEGK
jgi:hypothetical protein